MENNAITNPKNDESGVSMRSLRAQMAFDYLNNRKTSDVFEDNLDKDNLDPYFKSQFKELHENMKQELVFLWDEIGILTEELECLKEQIETEQMTNNQIHKKKRQRLFGP